MYTYVRFMYAYVHWTDSLNTYKVYKGLPIFKK